MHWLDPEVLPRASGRIAHYTVNAHGDVDGCILDDGRQVHVPPHMGSALTRLVPVGDFIEVRFVKPRDADVLAAVSVADASGKAIVDGGPSAGRGHPPAKRAPPSRRPMHVAGRVRRTLYAPKGEICGAVLDDGTQLRVDPKANAELADYFATDAAVEAWGEGLKRKGVTVVDVHEIAFEGDVD